ncbi:MAG: TonB family protein, partial [Oligoflexia bacterium]|nr:TonB family protein [Oligoflexia bacterium]
WRVGLAVFLLALFLHLAVLPLKVRWRGVPSPAPVEVQPFDAERLADIRRQWKDLNTPKELLLGKERNEPDEAPAPPDARYFSDRNRSVEKEQRARDTAILPRPGQGETPAQPRARPSRPRGLPSVSDLGVPLPLFQNPATPPRTAAKSFEPGADQRLRDSSLPEGGENLLNTQQSVYYSFYARLYEAIGPLWQSRLNAVYDSTRLQPGSYTTVAEVVMDRDGNLQAIEILRSSGVEAFDRAVIDSWRKIQRFPNPPQGLTEADGKVRTGWNFTVQVGSGVGMRFLPPRRAY